LSPNEVPTIVIFSPPEVRKLDGVIEVMIGTEYENKREFETRMPPAVRTTFWRAPSPDGKLQVTRECCQETTGQSLPPMVTDPEKPKLVP
jgi:hypothetical protein